MKYNEKNIKTKLSHTPFERARSLRRGLVGPHTNPQELPLVIEALPHENALRAYAAWQAVKEVLSWTEPEPLPVIR